MNGQCLGINAADDKCIWFKVPSYHSKFGSYVEWRCEHPHFSISSSLYPSKKHPSHALKQALIHRHECLNQMPQRHTYDEGVSISRPLSVYEGFCMLGTSGNKQDSARALTPSLFNQIRGWPRPGAPQSPWGNGNADRSALLVGVKEGKKMCSLKRTISAIVQGEPAAH